MASTITTKLAKRLKELREEHGLTQEEAALDVKRDGQLDCTLNMKGSHILTKIISKPGLVI
ncbi:MAG: hypothetical protein O2904_01805 [bacterium]|nr:hypothetical protein [bacterium]